MLSHGRQFKYYSLFDNESTDQQVQLNSHIDTVLLNLHYTLLFKCFNQVRIALD